MMKDHNLSIANSMKKIVANLIDRRIIILAHVHHFVFQFGSEIVVVIVITIVSAPLARVFHVGHSQWFYAPGNPRRYLLHQKGCRVAMLHAPKAFHEPRRLDKSASRHFSSRQALVGAVFGRNHVRYPVIDLVLCLQFELK